MGSEVVVKVQSLGMMRAKQHANALTKSEPRNCVQQLLKRTNSDLD